MPIDLILDSLDGVDESEKPFFEETDDKKFKLDWSKRDEFVKKPVLAKNAELKREKDRLKALEKFKDFSDDDLTAFQEWKASRDDDDNGDGGGKKDDLDARKLAKQLKKEIEAEFNAKLAAKEQELETERSKFQQFLFESKLTEAAEAAGVVRMKQFRALNALDKQFGWKDGKLIALDPDGEESTDTADERFKQLFKHPDWQNLFGAKEKDGGSGYQKAGSAGGKKLERSKMTPKEKSDFIKEHGGGEKGLKAFLSLPM